MKTFREFILEMDPRTRSSIKPQIIRVERPTPPPKPMPAEKSKIVGSPIKSGVSILRAIKSLRSPAALAGAALGNVLSTPPNPTASGTLDAAKSRGDYKYTPKRPNGPIGKGGEKYL